MQEFNNDFNEINIVPKSETNDVACLNDEIYKNSFDTNSKDDNVMTKRVLSKKDSSNKFYAKIISSFVFLVAAVVVINIGIYIPVISEIFSPKPPAPTIILKPSYSFSLVSSTEEQIDFTLTLENVDLKIDSFYLYIVKDEGATDEFLDSVSSSIKEICQTKLTENVSTHMFTKYMSSTGLVNLKQNTGYAIIVVKDGEIVQKKSVKTAKMVYISSVNIDTSVKDKANRYLDIQVTQNSKFTNFNSLYFKIYNLTLDEEVKDFSIIPREYLSSFKARIPVKITDPVYAYELRIYYSTDNPEDIIYKDSFVKDEITYYWVYTYEKVIKF